MSDVVSLHCETTLPIPVERVLKGALERDMGSVIIIGKDKSGNAYYAASHSEVPMMLWEIKQFEYELMSKYAE